MKDGYVLMWRGIIGNPQFRGKDDEYAAMWLISKVAWQDATIRIGKRPVDVKRGEGAFAISYLADAWGCSKSTAHSTLKHFEQCGFVTLKAERDFTRVVLANYDTYQKPERKTERKWDAETNASRTLDRTQDAPDSDYISDSSDGIETFPERSEERDPNASPNANGTLARTNNNTLIKNTVNEGESPREDEMRHITVLKVQGLRFAPKASVAGLVRDFVDHGADPKALMRLAGECSLANLSIDDFKTKAASLLPDAIQTAITTELRNAQRSKPSSSRAAEAAKRMLGCT